MFLAIRKRMDEREEGFTLIELLVVVIIIGILAAIAIPAFLNQRERARVASMQSDLRNAAIEAETFFTEAGSYATLTTADVNGLATSGTTITVEVANAADYCLKAVRADASEDWEYDSDESPQLHAGDCT